MYLSNNRPHTETLNQFGKAAYDSHIIGKSKDDIIKLVKDVIDGNDIFKTVREEFLKKYLAIPNTGNASINIINSILNDQ